MPKKKSKRKNGEIVQHNADKRSARLDDMDSGLTLQDLINVVAYQEYVADGTIAAEETYSDDVIEGEVVSEEFPLMAIESEEHLQIGTLSLVAGDPDSVAVDLTDEEAVGHILEDKNEETS